MTRLNHQFAFSLACFAVLAIAHSCPAHFLWLKTIEAGGEPQAFLFFGENSDDEAYHMPASIAGAKIWRRAGEAPRKELATEKLETDDRIGLVAKLPDNKACVLETSQQYGVYGNWLLTYHAKHVHATSNDTLAAAGPSKELKLDVVPRAKGEQLELLVLWNGKPLNDAEVSVAVGDADAAEKKTDDKGIVTVTPGGDGLATVMANFKDESVSGELDGKEFKVAAHFITLTFPWQAANPQAAGNSPVVRGSPDPAHTADRRSPERQRDETFDPASAAVGRPATTNLPQPLASFGAVVSDGWLYIYGGHVGETHDHSMANLSKHFQRVKLDGDSEWEELPMQTPLQGLPLVAHDGNIYRVGGLHARNPTTDEEEDMHSSDEFTAYDPSAREWTALAPLPAPRSSHNAVVIDDKLYVVGGWQLAGASPGEWQPGALVYDFADPQAGWQTLPEPPFQRRALAASHWQGKLVVLGGMTEEGEVSQDVFLFDPQSGQWTEGPDLPGGGRLVGFGISAWNLDDELYVSGLRGIVFRLNDAGSEWEEAARLETPRFFHQLVPAPGGGLLAVGGASRSGHVADIEWIDVAE